MQPLVSILIPLFNAERWIGDALESALAQTWQNKEIIVVNDGSTDRSAEIAQRYESEILKIITQENHGCSAAKQTAIENCNGDFIQYLDADDLLSENKIEAQMKVLSDAPEKVSVCRTVFFYDGEDHATREAPDEWYLYDTDDPAEFLIDLYGGNGRAGMISSNAYLTPRTVAKKAGGWDLTISPSPDEDGEYFCRVVLASAGIRFVPTAFNYYRKHRNGKNLSRLRSPASMRGALRSLDLVAKHLLTATNDIRAKQAMARNYLECAYIAYPDFPEVSEAAFKRVEELGGTDYVPSVGGWKGKTLHNLFGWKMARKIRIKGRRVLAALAKEQ
jgi:glycosyltransferase involved in cell wall biosynthesis